ncbi:MAG: hypothetical protein J7M26_07585, partial [Armatimonadetes bacterium]|nr:hypothetical protein [Armatimonadota bacterium]
MAQRLCIVVILLALMGFAGMTVFKQVKQHREAVLAKENQEVVPVVATTVAQRGTIEQTFIRAGTVEGDT